MTRVNITGDIDTSRPTFYSQILKVVRFQVQDALDSYYLTYMEDPNLHARLGYYGKDIAYRMITALNIGVPAIETRYEGEPVNVPATWVDHLIDTLWRMSIIPRWIRRRLPRPKYRKIDTAHVRQLVVPHLSMSEEARKVLLSWDNQDIPSLIGARDRLEIALDVLNRDPRISNQWVVDLIRNMTDSEAANRAQILREERDKVK